MRQAIRTTVHSLVKYSFNLVNILGMSVSWYVQRNTLNETGDICV